MVAVTKIVNAAALGMILNLTLDLVAVNAAYF
jgi:hypothetical protein